MAAALEERRYAVELVEVETAGDRLRDELIHRLGRTGAFARAVDEAVLDGEADAAVHSMKDLPTESPEELILAGVPQRGRAVDCLVTPDGVGFADLASGARVGTSSLRRRGQLLRARGDLEVRPLRGNVDTRIETLLAPHLRAEYERRLAAEDGENDGPDEGRTETADEWADSLGDLERRALGRDVGAVFDAIVLAGAGLDRAGLTGRVRTDALPVREFVPAPGQGAIAVTAVDGTDVAEAIHDAVDDPRTRVETTVERIVLAELGGGCIAPLGIYAVVQGETVHVSAQVLARDGSEAVEGSRDLPIRTYAEAAAGFADDLAARGAGGLIEAARDEAAGTPPPRDDG